MIRLEVSGNTRDGRTSIWWRNMVKHALFKNKCHTRSHLTEAHGIEFNRAVIVALLKKHGGTLRPEFWDSYSEHNYIEFENDADATAFILRWS